MVDGLANSGLRSFHNCENLPVIAFFGIYDGDKVIVRAFRRDDVDEKFIAGLGPELAKHAAKFLENIDQ